VIEPARTPADGHSDEALRAARMASTLYGPDGAPDDDPAELFHEAAKLYKSTALRSSTGIARMYSDPRLQLNAKRAVKRNASRPVTQLPEPRYPAVRFDDVLRRRRSATAFAPGALTLAEVATLVDAGCGLTHVAVDGLGEPQTFRTAPSAGALYPLELYAIVASVSGLDPGLYHVDPLAQGLEHGGRPDAVEALAGAAVYPPFVDECALTFVVTAMFWRSRVKYGVRGVRFALLEAGHAVQNILLACTALGLSAVPIGGFYDRLVDELVGADGVNESSVYAVHVGRKAEA
jgi:SagB-type dehydrogenase family enzyme